MLYYVKIRGKIFSIKIVEVIVGHPVVHTLQSSSCNIETSSPPSFSKNSELMVLLSPFLLLSTTSLDFLRNAGRLAQK